MGKLLLLLLHCRRQVKLRSGSCRKLLLSLGLLIASHSPKTFKLRGCVRCCTYSLLLLACCAHNTADVLFALSERCCAANLCILYSQYGGQARAQSTLWLWLSAAVCRPGWSRHSPDVRAGRLGRYQSLPVGDQRCADGSCHVYCMCMCTCVCVCVLGGLPLRH